MPETIPETPVKEPKTVPEPERPRPATRPEPDPFEPSWPETRPEPQPKAIRLADLMMLIMTDPGSAEQALAELG